jgi:hypothetical protein
MSGLWTKESEVIQSEFQRRFHIGQILSARAETDLTPGSSMTAAAWPSVRTSHSTASPDGQDLHTNLAVVSSNDMPHD